MLTTILRAQIYRTLRSIRPMELLPCRVVYVTSFKPILLIDYPTGYFLVIFNCVQNLTFAKPHFFLLLFLELYVFDALPDVESKITIFWRRWYISLIDPLCCYIKFSP